MNVLILYNLRRGNKAFSKLQVNRKHANQINHSHLDGTGIGKSSTSVTEQDNKDKPRQEAETHLTRMLLVITTSFTVFSIPTCVRYKISLCYIMINTPPKTNGTDFSTIG